MPGDRHPMGGTNPYMKSAAPPPPTRPYKVTFEPLGRTVEVDPAELPYSRDGQVGSILEIALGHDVEIDHACGGVSACSTCHVILREGFDSLKPAEELEEDLLDKAWGLEPTSRLSCQTIVADRDLVVEVPKYTINMVKE